MDTAFFSLFYLFALSACTLLVRVALEFRSLRPVVMSASMSAQLDMTHCAEPAQAASDSASVTAERKTPKFDVVLIISSQHDMRTPFASFKLFLVVGKSEKALVRRRDEL